MKETSTNKQRKIDSENKQIDLQLNNVLDMARDFFGITETKEEFKNGGTKKETE